jgi:transcriptional regulator with XRE-family HTH domain
MPKPKKAIHPVDAYAGERLRIGRLKRGMSQAELGRRIFPTVTFQQIQKYEQGLNRITISRLVELAAALDVPESYFLSPHEEITVRPFSPDKAVLPLSDHEWKLIAGIRRLTMVQQRAIAELIKAVSSR